MTEPKSLIFVVEQSPIDFFAWGVPTGSHHGLRDTIAYVLDYFIPSMESDNRTIRGLWCYHDFGVRNGRLCGRGRRKSLMLWMSSEQLTNESRFPGTSCSEQQHLSKTVLAGRKGDIVIANSG